jgi:hypothetical protein
MKQIFALFIGGFVVWLLFIRKKTTQAVSFPVMVPISSPSPIETRKIISDVLLTAPEPSLVDPVKTALTNIANLTAPVVNYPSMPINNEPVQDPVSKKIAENNSILATMNEKSLENTIAVSAKTQEKIDTLLSTGQITQTKADELNNSQKVVRDAIKMAKIAQENVKLTALIPQRIYDQRPAWRKQIAAEQVVVNSYANDPSRQKFYLDDIADLQKRIDDMTAKYDNNPKYILYTL